MIHKPADYVILIWFKALDYILWLTRQVNDGCFVKNIVIGFYVEVELVEN